MVGYLTMEIVLHVVITVACVVIVGVALRLLRRKIVRDLLDAHYKSALWVLRGMEIEDSNLERIIFEMHRASFWSLSIGQNDGP